jgi:WD40 repeat protein
MAVSPDYRYAYSTLVRSGTMVEDSTLSVWEMGGGDPLWSSRITTGSTQTAQFIGMTGVLGLDTYDPRTRASGTSIVETRTGKKVRTFPTLSPLSLGYLVTPDGKVLVSGSSDGTLQFLDFETGKEVATVRAHQHPLRFFTVSSDGACVASCAWGEAVRVWKVPTGEEVRFFGGDGNPKKNRLAFSPDGKTLAVTGPPDAGASTVVDFYEVATGRRVRTLETGRETIVWMLFSPDGSRLAAHCSSPSPKSPNPKYHLARMWDLKTGGELPTMFKVPGAGGVPCSPSMLAFWIDFSQEGRCVILGRMNDDPLGLSLWELESGEEVRRFPAKGAGP